ncbi:MAG: hypothetical protein U0228_30650 [Myxococcaceae bacterium]
MFALILVSLSAAPPAGPVLVDGPTFARAAKYDVAIADGKLLWRARTDGAGWQLLPPDGLPAPRGRLEALKELTADLPVGPPPFRRPVRVEALSADGDNLVAMTADGAVYYTKLSTLEWTDTWGPPGVAAQLSTRALEALAMSHRKIPYEDLDGNPHPISAGVTTFYGLRRGGSELVYADPWLPPNFERRLCLPERGTFVAAALAASASTVFVMDETGRAFTRLVDFDIHGDNPALPYSWARARRSGPLAAVRTLPAPDWVEQPRIPGTHTLLIGIEQTGNTNADRELAVIGLGGVWRKKLGDAAWAFEKRADVPRGPAVRQGAPTLMPLMDQRLVAREPFPGTKVALSQWNALCPPAVLELDAQGESLRLPLPFHYGLTQGTEDDRQLRGALLLPKGSTPWLKKLRALAAGQDFLEVDVSVNADEVRVTRLPGVDLHFPR